MDYFARGLIVLLLACVFVHLSTGSAWLQDPPSRSAAWKYQIRAPVNYNFRNLNCGGEPVEIEANGSRNCGLCGDPVSSPSPRPNEYGGKYANPIILTRYYEAGQTIEVSIWNSMPGTPGFYEFRLCTDAKMADQACLNSHLLMIDDVNSTNIPVSSQQGLHLIKVQLPAGVTCDYCLLQWRFRKENSVAGCDRNNWCGLGRGPQIEFYNCADVMVGAVGQPKPDYIQDPTYTSSNTEVTTPSGSNLVGTTDSTTTSIPVSTTTSRRLIFTVPTPSPFTVTTIDALPAALNQRLIVDSSGNPVSGVVTLGGGDSSSGSSRGLLVLLGLLPLLGAVGLNSNNNARIPPPSPIPRAPASFWAPTPPLSEYVMETGFGFGNFGSTHGTGTGNSGLSSARGYSEDVTRMKIVTSEATERLSYTGMDTDGWKFVQSRGHNENNDDNEPYNMLNSMVFNNAEELNSHNRLRRAVGGYGHKQAEYSPQGTANGAGMAANNWTPQNNLPQNTVRQNTMPQNTVRQNTMPQNSLPQLPLSQNSVPQNVLPQAGYSNNQVGNEYTQSGNQQSTGWQGNNNWKGNGGMMTNTVPNGGMMANNVPNGGMMNNNNRNSITNGQMISGQSGAQMRMPSGSSGIIQSQQSTQLNNGFTKTVVQNNVPSNSWNQGSGSTSNNIVTSSGNTNNNNNNLNSWMKQENPMVHDWYNRLMGLQTGPVG